MEGTARLSITVVAEDINVLLPEVVWHRRYFNLLLEVLMLGPHVTERFEAEWTLILVLREVLKAAPMECVATVQKDALFLAR